MSDQTKPEPVPPAPRQQSQPIIIRQEMPAGRRRSWMSRLLFLALLASILANVAMYTQFQEYFAVGPSPIERYRSGAKNLGAKKIAVIEVTGTIMPPFTKRILKAIEKAEEDELVKGVVLVVDSPGGFVADSHQIYHRLSEFSKQKPVVVVMKRMAASGGYYIAMGAGSKGKIYAEPTTWTGSIGVIIPRYNAKVLAEKVGVTSEPLKTGDFKDTLSPFREMTEAENEVWKEILDDAFQRFVKVIADNRAKLDLEAVRKLATGQIYTAGQAMQNGLIDKIGYEDDAIEDLKQQLGLETVRVVIYEYQPNLLEMLTGTVKADRPQSGWHALLEASVPRAMYYCSWGLGLPGW